MNTTYSQYHKDYYNINKEKIKEKNILNREKRLKLSLDRYYRLTREQKDIINAKRRLKPRRNNWHNWKRKKTDYKSKILEHYGNKCFCCGESTKELLCVDHINNNGKEHCDKNGKRYRGELLYKLLIKLNYPKDIQIACWNCNIGRQLNKGICPHNKII